jgi:drug/metabolite transporter (DMT)-like permease
MLTSRGENSSVVNFYTYLGLTILGGFFTHSFIFTGVLLSNVLIMGFLGCLGNYFIIKALSCGELSILAPINSYKPIVALIFGIIFLHEIPSIISIIGISLIIFGTLFLSDLEVIFSKSCLFRIFALVFSGTEAIFIKKVILLTDISTAFFLWAMFGLIFSLIIAMKHPLKISKQNISIQFYLILMVGIMQYSTNFVFSKMNVAYALALFQLSTILSIFLGVNFFHEKNLLKKIIASSIMILGAVILIIKQ